MVARHSSRTSISEKGPGKNELSFGELPVNGVFLVIFVFVHTSLIDLPVNSYPLPVELTTQTGILHFPVFALFLLRFIK